MVHLRLPDDAAVEVEEACARCILSDLVVRANLADDGSRYVQIGEFPLVRCGGTHVTRLSELYSLAVRKIKQKNGIVRIGYELGHGSGASYGA